MLGALAALAIAVGVVGSAQSLAVNQESNAAQDATAVVEVQAIESVDTAEK